MIPRLHREVFGSIRQSPCPLSLQVHDAGDDSHSQASPAVSSLLRLDFFFFFFFCSAAAQHAAD